MRDSQEPSYLKQTMGLDEGSVIMPDDLGDVLLKLFSSPNIASKRWVYEQYDQTVRTNNLTLNKSDAAVVVLKENHKGLALTTDCNARYVFLNPYRGGMIAVAEASRNVVCSGGEPLAITNCLNFGNPYKPEMYWQFREAVRGIADACRALGTPVTGGNVSFYNENPTGAVHPTPVIGMLGIVDDLARVTTLDFKDEGDIIVLLGKTNGHLGGSEYLSSVHGIVAGDAPPMDVELEKRVQRLCMDAIRKGLIKSAHDCSECGFAVALAECCFSNNAGLVGAQVNASFGRTRPDRFLFGEDQSRIIVSVAPDTLDTLLQSCGDMGVYAEAIGTVGGSDLGIGDVLRIPVSILREAYENCIPHRMKAAYLT
jgi:phosphoribosylformylglycinamidine synthase